MDNKSRSRQIAEQNDRFRKSVGVPPTGREEPVPGVALMTDGINALSIPQKLEIMTRVREFDSFTQDNDPYGEHDFGSFTLEGMGKIYWKIDYYDTTLTYGSEDPSDLSMTQRVLTILLAEEY